MSLRQGFLPVLSFSRRLRNHAQSPAAAPLPGWILTRGKKTKVTIELDSLPQGVIPLEPLPPLPSQRDTISYPTVVQQARDNMRKFENCVLLTRVGGFYELYFEHATEFGPLLGLKVAQKKTNAGPVSMAGFPFFQLDRYLKILVQDFNRYVAISEEFPYDPSSRVKSGGLLHDRRVSRVITPGTLIDENFMDPFTNNYILAVHCVNRVELLPERDTSLEPIGLAWLDLSTGHFFTQSSKLSALHSFLARVGPREILLNEALQSSKSHDLFTVLAENHHLVTYTGPAEVMQIPDWADMLESPVPDRSVGDFTPEEVAAGSSLLQYVKTRLQGLDMKLQPPVKELELMGIDKNTMRTLEIKRTIGDDIITGSLLHTIRRTVTKGGARLLENWLSSPSTSPTVINSRLDLVTHMLNNQILREKVIILLRRCHDSHRLLQKFAFGRGDPDDLLALASTIDATQELEAALYRDVGDESIERMLLRINLKGPKMLAKRIEQAIDEEGVLQQHSIEEDNSEKMQALATAIVNAHGSREDSSILPKSTARKKKTTSIREHYVDDSRGWIMKPGASQALKRMHQTLSDLMAEKRALEEDLCARLGATSLTLRFSSSLGHVCHVKGKDMKLDLAEVRSVSSSKSTRSFHHAEWTNLGQRIDQCSMHIRAEEHRVFQSLREMVICNIIKLRQNAAVLNELDIACSFATFAAEKNWTRPVLNLGTTHKIVAGRHPTVESSLNVGGRSFTTNDCFVGDVYRTWLITGPNMAGKSTFLRQNALITILAQAGSYVPASFAEIGIVDQIFSRIGSADNLYKDQSTFMVEMLETAQILRQATKRSFVIMDEIGRGTTPEDGEAVGWGCLWHLYAINKCRTLFATHFHGLADRAEINGLKGVEFWCTDVQEEGEDEITFRYVHKLKKGVNRKSHALRVARLAGLPIKAIDVAQRLLNEGKAAKDQETTHNDGYI